MNGLDLASWVLLCVGALWCVVSAIGLLRLPDFYARTHAAGLCDTMGAGAIVCGLMLQATTTAEVIKLLFVLGFVWFTSPVATHALVKAAYAGGVRADEGSG